MATLVTSLPVTTVTADDLIIELESMLQTQFTDWTDTQDSNNMIMLLETLSAIAELEYAYVNRLARECFIQFALDPNNVLAHAAGLGYTPKFQTSSTVSAIIQSASAVTADTVIPARTPFTSVQGAVYETVAPVVIRAGQSASTPVQLAQQQSWVDEFSGTGATNQSVTLNKSPVIPSSIVLQVNGVTWDEVDNFVNSIATDNVFSFSQTSAGVCSIAFGNGICGKYPPLGANISVNYTTGGGSANSIPANNLGACTANVADGGSGVLLSLNAYNALAAVPGADSETTDEIKANAVNNLIAPNVLLTRLDVQNAVAALSGVQACQAVNWEILSDLPTNVIQVFILPVGGGQPSDALVATVQNFLNNIKQLVMGVTPYVFGATFVTLNFNITLGVKAGYTPGAVQNAIIAMMVQMFDVTQTTPNFQIGFGLEVFMSQVSAVLQQIAGVQNLTMNAPGDTPLTWSQFPLLGTITFA